MSGGEYVIHVPADDVDKYRIYAMQLKIASQELALQAAHKGIRRLKERVLRLSTELDFVSKEEAYWRSFAGLEPALRNQRIQTGASET